MRKTFKVRFHLHLIKYISYYNQISDNKLLSKINRLESTVQSCKENATICELNLVKLKKYGSLQKSKNRKLKALLADTRKNNQVLKSEILRHKGDNINNFKLQNENDRLKTELKTARNEIHNVENELEKLQINFHNCTNDKEEQRKRLINEQNEKKTLSQSLSSCLNENGQLYVLKQETKEYQMEIESEKRISEHIKLSNNNCLRNKDLVDKQLEQVNGKINDLRKRLTTEMNQKATTTRLLSSCRTENEQLSILKKESKECEKQLTNEKEKRQRLSDNCLEAHHVTNRIIDQPPVISNFGRRPLPEGICGNCYKPVNAVILTDNSKVTYDDYELRDEFTRVNHRHLIDLWYRPYQNNASSGVKASALFCRYSNRLQVDAKISISERHNRINYYDYGSAHGPGKIPPHYDKEVNQITNLGISACKDKLLARIGAKTIYGDPILSGEEKWAWRGTETNFIPRKVRAENGEGTGGTFFYSMLGDLNDFLVDNQFLHTSNEKSFLFLITDAWNYFMDTPNAWKKEDARVCLTVEPDTFRYPYELDPFEVCQILKDRIIS